MNSKEVTQNTSGVLSSIYISVKYTWPNTKDKKKKKRLGKFCNNYEVNLNVKCVRKHVKQIWKRYSMFENLCMSMLWKFAIILAFTAPWTIKWEQKARHNFNTEMWKSMIFELIRGDLIWFTINIMNSDVFIQPQFIVQEAVKPIW